MISEVQIIRIGRRLQNIRIYSLVEVWVKEKIDLLAIMFVIKLGVIDGAHGAKAFSAHVRIIKISN